MSTERGSTNSRVIIISITLSLAIGFFAGRSYKRDGEIKETKQPGVTGKRKRKIKYWQAPMDPTYIRDKPGKSPMGMDLIPVYEDEEETGGRGIKIDPVVVQNMGVRTVKVRKGRLEKVIRTIGHLDYDERKVGYVTTKMSGWIEKLYVDYTGQEVERGDPLFEIYSPELISAQKEYLLSLKGRLDERQRQFSGNQMRLASLYRSAKQRLRYWDISERQIRKLEEEKRIRKTLTIYSPFSGIVVHKNILEGQYQKAGTNLYKIADLSTIWAYVHIYEYELPWLTTGLEAEMKLSYIPGKVFRGKVTYIYPYLSKKTRDVKVRLEFANPHLKLKPDMYANVRIKSVVSEEAIIIPEEAVIDTGEKQIVFIAKGEGRFEPREVTVGIEGAEGLVQILNGLDKDEVVVTSGQFLIDSESKLQEAIQKMLKPKGQEMKVMKQEGKEMKHGGHKMKHGAMDMDQGRHKMDMMEHGGDKMEMEGR